MDVKNQLGAVCSGGRVGPGLGFHVPFHHDLIALGGLLREKLGRLLPCGAVHEERSALGFLAETGNSEGEVADGQVGTGFGEDHVAGQIADEEAFIEGAHG